MQNVRLFGNQPERDAIIRHQINLVSIIRVLKIRLESQQNIMLSKCINFQVIFSIFSIILLDVCLRFTQKIILPYYRKTTKKQQYEKKIFQCKIF